MAMRLRNAREHKMFHLRIGSERENARKVERKSGHKRYRVRFWWLVCLKNTEKREKEK